MPNSNRSSRSSCRSVNGAQRGGHCSLSSSLSSSCTSGTATTTAYFTTLNNETACHNGDRHSLAPPLPVSAPPSFNKPSQHVMHHGVSTPSMAYYKIVDSTSEFQLHQPERVYYQCAPPHRTNSINETEVTPNHL